MFMDRNTQYCQDVSPSQLHLQVQYNPNHIPESYFVDIYKLIPNCVWGDVTKMTLQEAPVSVLPQQLTIRRASKIKTALGELRIPLKKFQPHSRKKKKNLRITHKKEELTVPFCLHHPIPQASTAQLQEKIFQLERIPLINNERAG